MQRTLLATLLLAGSTFAAMSADIPAWTATFEETTIPEGQTAWIGNTSATEYTESQIVSGSFSFTNQYTPEYNSWGAFAVTNSTSDIYTNFVTDQYNSAPGKAYSGKNYAICYVSDFNGAPKIQILDFNKEDNSLLSSGKRFGAWVAASAWTRQNVLEGDGQSPAFEKGDWFKVTFIGQNEGDEKTTEVEVYLADYRSDDAKDHYIADTWQWIDLTSLIGSSTVILTSDGSKKNEWGLTTASYIAIDNYGDEMPAVEKDAVVIPVGEEGVAVMPYFSFDSANGNISVEALSLPENIEYADGKLLRKAEGGDMTQPCILHASQRGHHEYVTIPVTDESGVKAVGEIDGWSLAGGMLRVACAEGATVSLVALDGRTVASAVSADGIAMIDVTSLSSGVYMLCGSNGKARKIML